jgi:hypothetical protein
MPGRALSEQTRAALVKYVSDGLPPDAAPAMEGSMSAPALGGEAMNGNSMNGSMGGSMNGSMNGSMAAPGAPKLPTLKPVEAAPLTIKISPQMRNQIQGKMPGLLNLILSAPEYQLA